MPSLCFYPSLKILKKFATILPISPSLYMGEEVTSNDTD